MENQDLILLKELYMKEYEILLETLKIKEDTSKKLDDMFEKYKVEVVGLRQKIKNIV